MCKALIEFPVILAHMLSPFCPNLADISASIPRVRVISKLSKLSKPSKPLDLT